MAFCINYLVIFTMLLGIINNSFSIAILPDKNRLEQIKPSPVDESQPETSSEKIQTIDPLLTERISDIHKKRESTSATKSEKFIEEDKTKETRKIHENHGRFTERDKLNCCDNGFESSSGRLESAQATTRTSIDANNRFPDHYGNRPDDRFSWHSSLGRPSGISSSTYNGVYRNPGSNTDRRFGLRPSYLNNNDAEYGNQGSSGHSGSSSTSSSINNKLNGGRPGYGYGYGGYGGYGDSGAYGSHGFEVNQRPGSIHFSGVGNRPGGGYGIYGTLGEQDEFPGNEGGVGPQIPSNIHTQKAVALKALAGVALIGAAAALAANPALIPVGAALAGRKRRSTQELSQFNLLEFPEQFIHDHVPRIYEDTGVTKKFWNSSKCVARLACEVQKEYLAAIRNDSTLRWDVQRQLDKLIASDLLNADYVRQSIKMLTKLVRDVNSKEGRCEIFTCDLFIP